MYLAENKGTAIPKLSRLPELLAVYGEILQRLADQGIEWVQIDEPILVLELADEWQHAFQQAYDALSQSSSQAPLKLLLATYFETLVITCRWRVTCRWPDYITMACAVRNS